MLTINVGLSRKASANFQSCGASVNVNAELDQTLLGRPAELQHQISYLYQQAQIALEHQMQRHSGHAEACTMLPPANGTSDPARHMGNGRHSPHGNGHVPPHPSPMSLAQRRAIFAIAEDLGLDAEHECGQVLNCPIDDLSIKQASHFIDHLRSLQRDQVRP